MKNETASRAVTLAVLARAGFRPRGDLLFFAEADEEAGVLRRRRVRGAPERLWPIRRTPYEIAAAGIHSTDERIHVDGLGYATRLHVEACRAIGALRPLSCALSR